MNSNYTISGFSSMAARACLFKTRDIVITKEGHPEFGRIGRLSANKAAEHRNDVTMQAFRDSLRVEYGTVGVKAFVNVITEALSNDLHRLFGARAREITLIRGAYADGIPEFMLDMDCGPDGPDGTPPADFFYGVYVSIPFLAGGDREATIRKVSESGRMDKVFNDYREAFAPAEGDTVAEKSLKESVLARIDEMEKDFGTLARSLAYGIMGGTNPTDRVLTAA